MSSEKLPRYYVGEPNDVGWASIGDRGFIGYGGPCADSFRITVYGTFANGVNTGHRYATEIAAILNAAAGHVPEPVAPAAHDKPTQRQLYKAAALQGLLANPASGTIKDRVELVVKYADAMIHEDEGHKKQ